MNGAVIAPEPRRAGPGRAVPALVAPTSTSGCGCSRQSSASPSGTRFFGHYYWQLFPPLCLLAARGADGGRREVEPAGRSAPAALTAVGAAIAAATFRIGGPSNDYNAIADHAKAHTTPDERIFVWGHETVGVLGGRAAGRRRGSITTGFLTGHTAVRPEGFAGMDKAVPGLWDDGDGRSRGATRPPSFFNMEPIDPSEVRGLPHPRLPPMAEFVAERYELVDMIGKVSVYKLMDARMTMLDFGTRPSPASSSGGARSRWPTRFYFAYSRRPRQGRGAGLGTLENARRLIEWERTLGMYHEHSFQQLVLTNEHDDLRAEQLLRHRPLRASRRRWRVYLFRRHPASYRLWRNVLGWTTGLALDRLLHVPADAAALLVPGLGFTDTMVTHPNMRKITPIPIWNIGNPYAAMPSLHIGWALWVCCALLATTTSPWVRRAAKTYPVVTFLAIVGTGNHFVLDAVGGAMVFGAAMVIALRCRRSPPRISQPAPAMVTTATDEQAGLADQTSSSAIWMALRAAPLRRLSLLTNSARPRPPSTVGSCRMRPT